MSIELSVIIVNYNGYKYLKDCFDSLNQQLKGISFEIIVIDNASSDASCTFIKTHYPEIKLIESKDNLGFGKGNNEAVKQAAGNYLLLINNDTVVLDPLLPVFEKLKENPEIGAATIRMLDGNQNYAISVGNFPNPANMFKMQKMQQAGLEIQADHFSKKSYETDWLSGSFIAMPKKVYQEIQGFDEDYFLYVEDVDFSKRIADKGYKRIFLPDQSYIHYVGFNKSKNPMLVKGYQLYISKHFSGLKKMIMQAALFANHLVKKTKSRLKLD